jgi:hypothetical protein
VPSDTIICNLFQIILQKAVLLYFFYHLINFRCLTCLCLSIQARSLCLRETDKKTVKLAFHAGCASKTLNVFHNLTGFIFSTSINTYHYITSDSHPHRCLLVSAINANLLLSHNSHSYESKNSKISFLLRGNIFSSFSNRNRWSFDTSSP